MSDDTFCEGNRNGAHEWYATQDGRDVCIHCESETVADPPDELEDHLSEMSLAFIEFHADHPEVYEELVQLALAGLAAGWTRLGIGQLFEVLRWERMLSNLPAEGEIYKLNNNYRSRYARLIMAQEPTLAEIFETRALSS